MAQFTTGNMSDLSGRRAVVTGANSGLGFQTSLALAAKGAHVTLACRDERRGRHALARLRDATGSRHCSVAPLDLGSLASVRDFVRGWDGPLDLLINNAGIMATPRALTADGFEAQLGVNHLGHFALTGLLLPALRRAGHGRVVSVSSLAHRRGRIDFGQLDRFDTGRSLGRYRPWDAYAQSKIANLIFALELDRRLAAAADTVSSVAAHPGVSATNLTAGAGRRPRAVLLSAVFKTFGQSAARGALPILYAATGAQVQGGDYYGPDGAGGRRGNVTMAAPVPRVLDAAVAGRLWSVSEALTGVRYPGLAP